MGTGEPRLRAAATAALASSEAIGALRAIAPVRGSYTPPPLLLLLALPEWGEALLFAVAPIALMVAAVLMTGWPSGVASSLAGGLAAAAMAVLIFMFMAALQWIIVQVLLQTPGGELVQVVVGAPHGVKDLLGSVFLFSFLGIVASLVVVPWVLVRGFRYSRRVSIASLVIAAILFGGDVVAFTILAR